MRWKHDTLRGCTLDVGSGRGAIKIDKEGYVIDANEYALNALVQWSEAIGFKQVEDAPKKKRKRK